MEWSFEQKMIQDERDETINSKSYKLDFVLDKLSLFLTMSKMSFAILI
jgi:hypothetical protein